MGQVGFPTGSPCQVAGNFPRPGTRLSGLPFPTSASDTGASGCPTAFCMLPPTLVRIFTSGYCLFVIPGVRIAPH